MPVRSALASRRSLLGGAAATGAAATIAAGSPASAAPSYAPAHYRGKTLLPAKSRHLVGRFSYGVTPALAAQVRAAGGARPWFVKQLAPSKVADPAGEQLDTWWPSLHRGATELWKRNVQEVEGGWEVMADYQRWVLLRRIRSQRQVLEVMTEFWEHHFNVPVNGDAQFTWRSQYGKAIRAHALGRFDDLLHATTTHPAMLINLDNVSSTAEHPNENLGRELLELHTVGRGAYTEAHVKDSARILTGWTVDMWNTFAARYDPQIHSRQRVTVMGFTHPNAKADGRDVTRAYLTYLAHHPATAKRIARRLAVKFVSDNPPQALVDRLAKVYLANDTRIVPVLLALVDSPAFQDSVGAKVRDPGEDIVATYRALDIRVTKPPATEAGEGYAANQILWQVSSLGITPFGWPRPDGQPIDNDSWASPARLVASMENHLNMGGGWWPNKGMTYHPPAWWAPKLPIRFDALVDHMSQVILHRRSTAQLLKACCQALDIDPKEQITRDHGVIKWDMHRLLSAFLDSPAFLTR